MKYKKITLHLADGSEIDITDQVKEMKIVPKKGLDFEQPIHEKLNKFLDDSKMVNIKISLLDEGALLKMMRAMHRLDVQYATAVLIAAFMGKN